MSDQTDTLGGRLPLAGQEIRIVDEGGCEVPEGVDGEVAVRGSNVMRGYLARPDETERVIVDGWLHTGDVGHLDAEGYLTLVGRSKDMIIRGGENVYPKDIEDVLASDPAVVEAAVIGLPDDKWGAVVAAYVQPRPGLTVDPAALQALCARNLSGYKRPTTFFVVDAIPRNAVGKIDKATLRAAHASAHRFLHEGEKHERHHARFQSRRANEGFRCQSVWESEQR